jgi:hypothetical protein
VRYKAQLKLLEVFDDEIDWSDKQRLAGPNDEPVGGVSLTVVHTDADDFENETRTG